MYSTCQLNECNMAKINALLEVECKRNFILEFMLSILLFLFMIFIYCNEFIALTRINVGSYDWLNVFLVQCLYIRLVLTKFRGCHLWINLICCAVFNSFSMKNKLYIDSMDLLHFAKKINKLQNKKNDFWGGGVCFYNNSLKIKIYNLIFYFIIT